MEAHYQLYETVDYSLGAKLTDGRISRIIDNMIIAEKDDKYGIILLNSKNIDNPKIDFKYDMISDLYNELFIIKQNDKYGLMNTNGEEIISPSYDYMYKSSDMFIIQENKKYGLLNSMGKLVIEPTFERLYSFVGNYAVVRLDTRYGVINKKGEIIVPCQYFYQLKIVDKKYAMHQKIVIDLETNETVRDDYDRNFRYICPNRLLVTDRNIKLKIVDFNHKKIKKLKIKDTYGNVKILKNGFIIDGNHHNNYNYGVYNSDGKFIGGYYNYRDVYDDKYTILNLVIESKIFCTLNNQKGENVLNDLYYSCEYCRPGVYILQNEKRHDLFIDEGDNKVCKSYSYIRYIDQGFIAIKNKKYGLLDNNGQGIYDTFIYDKIDSFYYRDGILIGTINNQNYLLNLKGKVLNNNHYDEISFFIGGVAQFKRGDVVGLITDKGQEIVYKDFSSYGSLDNGYIYGYNDINDHKLYSLYDPNGKVIFEDKLINSIKSFNNEQIIIDNHLFNIENIKDKYLVEIEYNDQLIIKEFKTIEERTKYLDHFNNFYIEQINKWLNGQKRILTHYNKLLNKRLDKLCGLIPNNDPTTLLNITKKEQELESFAEQTIKEQAKIMIKHINNEE